jgi:putative intracellular protease/amidase
MSLDRRTLLAGLTGAPALSPLASRAATESPREKLEKLFGDKLIGNEQIAMLLYPGMTALDLVGPYHYLACMAGAKMHLVTNQPDLRPVPSDLGLALQPTVTMADCPADLTIIFCPGGTFGTLAAARDKATIDFIRDRAKRAQFVTSVCTGSLILGAAGVLRGKRATSHWSVVPLLSQFGATPSKQRVVRDGNVITGAGVSAGMDFGASLVAELRGKPLAETTTLIAEYAPEPPFASGSLEMARPEIAGAAATMLEGFVADAKTLRTAD